MISMKAKVTPWIFIGLLAWTIGLVAFPFWWYEFLVGGKFRDLNAWNEGITYIGINILVPAAAALGCFLALWFLRRWSHEQANWHYPIRAKYLVALAISFVIALGTLGFRSQADRALQDKSAAALKELEKTSKEIEQSTKQWMSDSGRPLLEKPVTFLFLDAVAVDNLYDQNREQLELASVTRSESQQTQASAGIDGSPINIKASISGERGSRSDYRTTDKLAGRKLRDVLQSLDKRSLIKTYGVGKDVTPDVAELDRATQYVIANGLSLDQQRVQRKRDELLAGDIARLRGELAQWRGLVLVQGDWQVHNNRDSVVLRRSLLESVSTSPDIEVTLPKGALDLKDRTYLEAAQATRLTLGILGNSITSYVPTRPLSLVPIAVYAPTGISK